jgi:hypothetical protein
LAEELSVVDPPDELYARYVNSQDDYNSFVFAPRITTVPDGTRIDQVGAMVAWLVSEENSSSTGVVFDLSEGRAATC